ncbi:STAS domain-containing protein [Actinokineospora spheciospongiae]|uniref:STAS domain-containing protein n=1 Tax=Actinokineospora spheciospongiae TaxID=909613 RepID=UPI000D711CBD|nr:STAS domain-containing protein [Actinokineospora spheciospongiae]PWW60270.1 anti-anti-sigma factor [Actinokineospora spheciospongiae]
MDEARESGENTFEVVADGRAVVVTTTCDVDMSTADGVRTQWERAAVAAVRAGAALLVVDLRAVAFLSSVGISALMLLSASCSLRGVELLLCLDEGQAVRRALDLTGVLGTSLPAVSSIEEALRHPAPSPLGDQQL